MRSHLTLLLAPVLAIVFAAPVLLLEAQPAATNPFFDTRRPEAERIKAIQSLGYPDERTKAALFAVGSDRSQSDAIRWEEIGRASCRERV